MQKKSKTDASSNEKDNVTFIKNFYRKIIKKRFKFYVKIFR